MTIGINAIAAFKHQRTGVEEYTYQLIKYLAEIEESKKYQFVLYINKLYNSAGIFNSTENFKIKKLKWPWPMWTQIRLGAEMFFNQPEVLFIPVHILPLIHPKNSVVTIHGLEYEYYPKMYPPRHLRYLRWSTKYALKQARRIIAVSENTKKDLIELYGGKSEKIEVIYHGVDSKISNFQFPISNKFPISNFQIEKPYILFIGRLERKKNIHGLIQAFNLLKERYKIPHKLVLAGPKGYDFTENSSLLKQRTVLCVGYVSEEEKRALLKNADVFVLPSFYEGFGLPILEAQAAGAPVVTSNISSMPEIAGEGAVLVEPKNIESLAEGIYKVIADPSFKKELIVKGGENVKRFSWEKCAKETLRILF